MFLSDISDEVMKLFNELEAETENFRKDTSINCPRSCGLCCYNPGIEATILEFIPLAFRLCTDNSAFEILKKIDEQILDGTCVLFEGNDPGKVDGRCLYYEFRGLICRTFGFSGTFDKHDKRIFMTCRIIKNNFKEKIQFIEEKLENSAYKIPMMSEYYRRLSDIDYGMAFRFYPVNLAIKLAIEKVLFYMNYKRSA